MTSRSCLLLLHAEMMSIAVLLVEKTDEDQNDDVYDLLLKKNLKKNEETVSAGIELSHVFFSFTSCAIVRTQRKTSIFFLEVLAISV